MQAEKLAYLFKLLDLIEELDNTTIMLPHNKDTLKAVHLSELHSIQASKWENSSTIDTIAEPWGVASEQQFCITVSLYLQTDAISTTLKEVYKHPAIKEHTMATGWRITPHTLLKRADQEIGFFLGKSIEHTWQDTIWSWLTGHLLSHGLDVPIAIQDNRIKATKGIAHVVSVFAGVKDARAIEACLKRHLFKECKILLKKHKHSNQEQWQWSIEVHKELSKATRAVKVVNADDSFLSQLRGAMEQDASVNCKVVDLACKGFHESGGILYVQCHQLHTDTLTAWIKTYIGNLNVPPNHAKNPRVGNAIYMQPEKKNDRPSGSKTPTLRTQRNLLNFTTCTETNLLFKLQVQRQGPRDTRVNPLVEDKVEDLIAYQLMWIWVFLHGLMWWKSKYPRPGKEVLDSVIDNYSQQSQETNKSTIALVKSHWKQELESLVEKLSIENMELKQVQQIISQSQQELMEANQELITKVKLVNPNLPQWRMTLERNLIWS